jgi:HEAT repeat protein
MSNDNDHPAAGSPPEDLRDRDHDNSNQDETDQAAVSSQRDLPPVEAPSSAFLLQLFLIPMIIVAIMVTVWFMFSWLAHLGSDPRELVRDLGSLNKASWQKALTLANMLRDAEHDALKDDEELAGDLVRLLDKQLELGSLDPARIQLRVYLCHCLGEFRLQTTIPTLLKAASMERDLAEVEVRVAALQSLAIMAQNVGPAVVRKNDSLVEGLLTISQLREDNSNLRSRNEIRSAAAYALGRIGGPRSLDRLAQMTSDSYPNSRFNAATGLARHGDPRAVGVLLEMLDADNPGVVAGESTAEARATKRSWVIDNGIRATGLFARHGTGEGLEQLQAALERIRTSNQPMAMKLKAKKVLLEIR